MSPEEKEMFVRACLTSNGVYVSADRIVIAGRLIEAGFAVADDDYEGPVIWATPAGIKHAAEMSLIELVDGEWMPVGDAA